jgi:iron complex outermembrane receptor protein
MLCIFTTCLTTGFTDDLMALLRDVEERVGQNLVVGASKRVERVGHSPSVVTIFTRSQIEKLNVSNLYELLSYAPGFELTESYFGFTSVGVRGVNQSIYNNKILLVINGHPFFENVNGNAHFEMIPINAIRKVEVIRGPGSALYGTNAYAGVVSVETIDGAGYENNLLSFETGSLHTSRLGFNLVQRDANRRGGLLISGTLADQSRWPYTATDERGVSNTIDYINDVQNTYINWKRDNITLQVGRFQQEKTKLGITPVFAYSGLNDFEGTMVDLSWGRNLDEKSNLKLRYGYNDFSRILHIGRFPTPASQPIHLDTPSESERFELLYTRNIDEKLKAITGFSYEEFRADPYYFLETTTNNISNFSAFLDSKATRNKAAFLQLDYRASEKLGLLGAYRQTDSAETGKSGVPRFGAVYSFDEDFNMKLLYGKAFRSASFFENYVNTAGVLFGPVPQGLSPLEDEKITQWDLVFEKKFAGLDTRLNFFHIETDDLISRRPGPGGVPEYFNSMGQKIKGVELEARGELKNGTQMTVNLSHRNGENLADGSAAKNISRFTGNLMLDRDMDQNWSWMAQLQHLGKREGRLTNGREFGLDDMSLVHAGISYKFDNDVKATFFVKNLEDKKVENFEYNRGNLESLPGGSGRGVYLKIEKRF